MSDVTKKVLWTIGLWIPTAVVGVILRKVFQVWGIFDPFSEWLGGWLKMYVTPTQAEWTIAGIFALLGYSALLWIVWKSHYITPLADTKLAEIPQPQRDMTANQQPESPPQRTDLQIIIGRGNNYETAESDNQNRVTKSVLVGVKNHNRNSYISNCKLHVKLPNEQRFRPLHDGSFTLNPGEEKFVSVAYRHEYIVRNNGIIDNIQFSIPDHGGGFLSDDPGHWVPNFITLKAEAFEARTYEIICKLWVDENGRLRLDKA